MMATVDDRCRTPTGVDMKIFVWDTQRSVALTVIDCHPDAIFDVAWNYDGSRLVTSCKDKIFRVIDPRTGAVLKV
jgi:coronin-1B/1C/6